MAKQYKSYAYIAIAIVIVICVICLLFKDKMKHYYENFGCPVDTDGSTHIECYYNRCINNYKIVERGGTVPEFDTDGGKALVLYYLDNQDTFPLFGCGGWINQVNKQGIVPEWAYYLFKLYRKNIGTTIGDTQLTTQTLVIEKKVEAFLDENPNEINYYRRHAPTKKYLNYEGKSGSSTKATEEIFIHQKLLTYFLIKLQKTSARFSPYNDVGLVWGLPYLTYTNTEGETEKFDATTNVPNFNYEYMIAFQFKPGNTLKVDKSTLYDNIPEYTKDTEYMYLMVDDSNSITLSQPDADSKGTSFIIEPGSDCNQYLRLKIDTGTTYLSQDGDTLIMKGESNATKFILGNDNNTELGLDIDSVLIPPRFTSGHVIGQPVNMIFESNNTQFFAHLGLKIEDDKLVPKIIQGSYEGLESESPTEQFKANIGDNTGDLYSKYFQGIVFIRGDRINSDTYGYQERRRARAVGTGGEGVIEDRGIIKMSEQHGDFRNAGENITTNQKLFPVMNSGETNLNNIKNKCKYTGTQTSDEAIKSICKKNTGCYGEYITDSDDGSGNPYKMAYVGNKCDRHLKYIDKVSENFDERVDRAKVKCSEIGTVIDDSSEGEKVKKCYLPRVHTKLPDGALTSLIEPKKYNEIGFCQPSLDYGVLDGPDFAMYNNNSDCEGKYELNGATLKSSTDTCGTDQHCPFNGYHTDDKEFLLTAPFGELMNTNKEMNDKLKKLKLKVNRFETQLQGKTEEDAKRDSLLVGRLNDFKVTKMQDNINRLNQHALEELLQQTSSM